MIFLVHLKFSTLESDERELLRNAKILRLREPGINRIFRFRLESFQRIRIHFHVNKGLEGKFPVVDVSPTTIDFSRHIGGGIVGTEKSVRHKEKLEVGVPQDFLVSLQGSQLQFLKISARGQLVVLGSHHYAGLERLPYVGFSSPSRADWVLERGQSGDKIRVGGRFYRSLQVECQLSPLSGSGSWTFLQDLNETELRTAQCQAAHSCQLSQIRRDLTVSLAGYRDHLNNRLSVLDHVKVLAV